LFGTSRSGKADFEKTIKLYEKHPEIVSYLTHIVGNVVEVSDFADIKNAFELDTRKAFGKTVMHWNL